MLNRVTLIGHLGKDPEIRALNSGKPVASFRLATSEQWRDRESGEKRERTEWHSVVVFAEPLCKLVENYCRKGGKVYVEGQLQTRKYTGSDNIERYTTEVVLQGYGGQIKLLDRPAGDRAPPPSEEPRGAAPASRESARPSPMRDAMDDDIPFAPEFR